MLKRVLTLVVAAGLLVTAGCASKSGCGSSCGSGCNPLKVHCESPCYCKSFQRANRQIMDVIDVHLLNYDRHDPFRCDPCIGD